MFRRRPGINKLLIVTALLLVVLYCTQIINQAFYLHSHRLADGSLVTHAHPFDKAKDNEPVKKHAHTLTQLITITNLQLLFPVVFLVMLLLRKRTSCSSVTQPVEKLQSIFLASNNCRAPPAL